MPTRLEATTERLKKAVNISEDIGLPASELFGDAIERSPLALVRTDGERHVVRYANPAFFHLSGVARDQLLGKPLFDVIQLAGKDACLPRLDKVVRDGTAIAGESLCHLDPRGGRVYWAYVAWAVRDEEGRVRGLMIQVTDSTAHSLAVRESAHMREVHTAMVKSGIERDEATERAEKAAERAEVAERGLLERQAQIETLNHKLRRAMTETHHRVKNNLQVISALIDMRLMENETSVPVDEVRRIATSAKTLAAVHEILTAEAKADGDAQTVSAAHLMEALLPMLQHLAAPKSLGSDISDFRVPPRCATALSLILSELVINAVKHGKDHTNVSLTVQNGTAQLVVADNGPGFPAGFDVKTAAHTGLELVEELTRWDLAGKTVYENAPEGGGRVTIQFPVADRYDLTASDRDSVTGALSS